MSSVFEDFHGDIDSLLEHCSKADTDEIEKVLNGGDRMLSCDEAVDCIAEDLHVDKETAKELYMIILMEEGLVEVVGEDADGKILYSCTDKGMEAYQKQLQRKHDKNP